MPPSSHAPTAVPEEHIGDKLNDRNCARMKDLGYTTGKHLNLYGEHLEIVSGPFTEGECVAVRATSGNDPTIRTIRLPVSLLVGVTDLFPEQ